MMSVDMLCIRSLNLHLSHKGVAFNLWPSNGYCETYLNNNGLILVVCVPHASQRGD